MVDDLMATWEELGNMLADVGENYGDMHADDVSEILDNCRLKATELTHQIVARWEYVQDIRALIPVTQRGADAGRAPARQSQGVPPVPGRGTELP